MTGRRSLPPVVVEVPGSKSLTIRALFAAALADGASRLGGPLDSDDTRHARLACRAIGAEIDDSGPDWTIKGTAGRPRESPGPIDVGESGLTARIMIPICCLIDGTTTLVGRGRLPSRPMGEILDRVGPLGGEIVEGMGIPCVIRGSGAIGGGSIAVDVSRSTQFGTALLMVAPLATGGLKVVLEGLAGSGGYLRLTLGVLRAFGARWEVVDDAYRFEPTGLESSIFPIEPDASSAVYPLAAAALTGRTVTVPGLGMASRQPDLAIIGVLEEMGCVVDWEQSSVTVTGPASSLGPVDIDASGWPDGAVALAALCAAASATSRIRGLHTLQYKESDRFKVLVEELRRVGASVEGGAGELVITPGKLVPTTVHANGDHRVAMSFGLLGLLDSGIVIDSPGVVSKTWPSYWDVLERLRG